MAGLYDNYVQTGNIFEGKAPTIGGYDWGSSGSSGGGIDWGQTPSIDWGNQFTLPGLEGTGALRSPQPNWLGKGMEALTKALSYRDQYGTGTPSRTNRSYGSNASAVAQGRGYTMYMPAPTQKSTQSGGSKGIGGALGTLAGAGIGFIAGGPAGAGLGATLGGTGGSLFG